MNTSLPSVAQERAGSEITVSPWSPRPGELSRKLVDPSQIASFLEMLFRYVEADEYAVMLRGIGEPGTPQEGKFRENVAVPLSNDFASLTERVVECATRWGTNQIATFILPAAMDRSILDDRTGTADRVKLFTTVVVDLDNGPTQDIVHHLAQHIGKPTMLVESGGVTREGYPKMHVWWALKEPSAE